MNIWFTADTHFGWKRIGCNLRKFESIEEHDRIILDNMHSKIKKNDIVYILGDFSEKPEKYRNKLPKADYRFIIGNHDNSNIVKDYFGKMVYEQKTITIRSDIIFLSHYPTIFWNGSHHGSYSLYGHVHSAREEWIDQLIPERKSMDVGVDNYKRLYGEFGIFNWEEIKDQLKNRKGHDEVEWYQNERGEI